MTITVLPERYPELIRAMDQAVASGRRLTGADVVRIAGTKLPESWNREDGPDI
jgi:Arc/MetJ-type ribon-helix-helix transcriptional regulator